MSNVVGIDGGKKKEPCEGCGGNHRMIRCPWVKSIEVDEYGSLAFVEFFEKPTSRGVAAPEAEDE